MSKQTRKLRDLLAAKTFLHMPAVYDPLSARLVEQIGFEAAYVGGYVTGASRAITEPLLTMTEQANVAGECAQSVDIPVLADAGAGFGEPLHTMRTIREFIRAGLAGCHIEDQLFPKRAFYHKYVAHTISREEYLAKLTFACRERDAVDKDFLVIARTDALRGEGFDEAITRLNLAADTGVDMGLLFPRSREEAERAPRLARLPLLYVQSRGNRDGRPLFTTAEMKQIGYRACVDAQVVLLTAFHYMKKALAELRDIGDTTLISCADFTVARKAVEDLIRLDEYYAIEEETVEGQNLKRPY